MAQTPRNELRAGREQRGGRRTDGTRTAAGSCQSLLLARQRQEGPAVVPGLTSPTSAGAHVEKSFPLPLLQDRSHWHAGKPCCKSKQREATETVQNCTTAPNRCAGADSQTQSCHPTTARRLGPASEGGPALGKDKVGACPWGGEQLCCSFLGLAPKTASSPG